MMDQDPQTLITLNYSYFDPYQQHTHLSYEEYNLEGTSYGAVDEIDFWAGATTFDQYLGWSLDDGDSLTNEYYD